MPDKNRCYNCQSIDTSLLMEGKDFFLSREDFRVMKCNSCGFVFTADIPTEKDIQKYYKSKKYLSHSDAGRGISGFLYRKARGRMLGKKMKLLKKVSGKDVASLLDIGSGTGYFPAYIQSKGWKADGIEINADAREFTKEKFALDLYSPEHINAFKPGSYDFITMWHTLEHFHDPGFYLKPAIEILKDDGFLVIALPNHHSFDAEFYGIYWAAWDLPRHLWHFNPSNIYKFMEKYGFKMRSIHRLPFDSFYVALLSERYRRSVFPFIQGSLIGFVSWITSLLRKKRSSSLIYIFKKSSY